MTHKQKKFIDAYLGEANGNATKAAEVAGYAGDDNALAVAGHENLRNPKIQSAIREIYAQSLMPPEEVLSRLSDQGRGAGPYIEAITKYGAVVDIERLLKDGKGHLVKGVKYTAQGQPVIEFYDAQAALKEIGRHHKLFTDKIEHDFSNLTDDDLKREIAELEGGATSAGEGAES